MEELDEAALLGEAVLNELYGLVLQLVGLRLEEEIEDDGQDWLPNHLVEIVLVDLLELLLDEGLVLVPRGHHTGKEVPLLNVLLQRAVVVMMVLVEVDGLGEEVLEDIGDEEVRSDLGDDVEELDDLKLPHDNEVNGSVVLVLDRLAGLGVPLLPDPGLDIEDLPADHMHLGWDEA